MHQSLFAQSIAHLPQGSIHALARTLSLVENEVPGYNEYLQQLPYSYTPVIGITGPPGAGKSTLVDALIGHWIQAGKKVAVLCVDPSSPFNLGAVLGDRIRMNDWYTHPHVFIRSLATRGSLGGLHPKILELTDVVKQAGFDYVIVETVGVGQSEIEIAGLADCTVVAIVPEAGDEVQTMKAGLMEIADLFVVNKADRPGADTFVKNLRQMLAPAFQQQKTVAIVKTVASEKQGIADLAQAIEAQLATNQHNERKYWLQAEKAWHIIQQHRMKGLDKQALQQMFKAQPQGNLYQLIQPYLQ